MARGFMCPKCLGFFPFLKGFQSTEAEYVTLPPTGDETLPPSYFVANIDWFDEEEFECPRCGETIAKNEDEASGLVMNLDREYDDCTDSAYLELIEKGEITEKDLKRLR